MYDKAEDNKKEILAVAEMGGNPLFILGIGGLGSSIVIEAMSRIKEITLKLTIIRRYFFALFSINLSIPILINHNTRMIEVVIKSLFRIVDIDSSGLKRMGSIPDKPIMGDAMKAIFKRFLYGYNIEQK